VPPRGPNSRVSQLSPAPECAHSAKRIPTPAPRPKTSASAPLSRAKRAFISQLRLRTACATKYSPKPIAAGNPNARAAAIVNWMVTRLSSSLLEASLESPAQEIVLRFLTSLFSGRGLFGTIMGFQFGRLCTAMFRGQMFVCRNNRKKGHLFLLQDAAKRGSVGRCDGIPASI
jgi:hypothetical protein